MGKAISYKADTGSRIPKEETDKIIENLIHKYGPEGCLYLSELFEDASIDDMLEGLKQADEMIET